MMKKKKKLIIYGDSHYAEMIAHYFEEDSEYSVIAYCVDKEYQTRKSINGIPVFPLEEILTRYSSDEYSLFAAIGYASVRTHKNLYLKVKELPYKIASYISTKAVVDSTANIGENCLILPGVILEPHTVVEDNCFLNSAVTVCHHAHIKAHSILAAGSLIGGYVTIGEASLIGFNATVTELLTVGEETLLGAGSVLLSNTKAYSMYVGAPARMIRNHKNTGIMMIPKK